ncbi:MAG: 2-hydroxyacyl-CoA dehydratase family protein, partial [Candidatus Methanoperedens sp.]|nr:2-hydroxyacyl-CoA dehydratase family protein [Candidatus Methanoperedens sp.]
PFADRFMEDGVFSLRIRGIFEGIASGEWPFLKVVVIPRTSEQEHKLFLYLREVARQGLSTAIPEVYLYNLLHARSVEAEQYGLQRTEEFRNYLRADDLSRAIEGSNQARLAIRKLLAFREGPEPQLNGREAMALIGAMYFMDRVEYAQLANQAASEISSREPIPGPRVLIKGSPLHHTGLHQAIESHGAVVVAEDDWWGSRAPAKEIPQDGDLVRAIFETCYFEAPSPRDPSNTWFLSASANVDAVVFYLPAEDDVLGWDYPSLRQTLDQRGTRSRGCLGRTERRMPPVH